MFFLPQPHRSVLDGVDEIDWVDLGGPEAADVPTALRSIAAIEDPGVSGVGDMSSEYLTQIAGADEHEPTAPTPVAVYLIPFYTALVSDPEVWDRTDPLESLIFIASSHRRSPDAQPELGPVLDGLAPFSLDLFTDPDDDIRRTAFFLAEALPLKEEGAFSAVIGALDERIAAGEAKVSTHALSALDTLLPSGETDRYLAPEYIPGVRRVAAELLAQSDRPWTSRATRAVLECWDGGRFGRRPYRDLVLTARDPDHRAHLLGAVRSSDVRTVKQALRVTSALCAQVRSERIHLVPVLGEVLDHPNAELRTLAARMTFENPPAARCLVDRLAALAETGRHEAEGEGTGDWAVGALLRAGDPRWRGPVLDTLRQNLVIAATTLLEQNVPFDTDLFEAAHALLRHSVEEPVPRAHELARLLVGWGDPAGPVAPVLARLARRDLARGLGMGSIVLEALTSMGSAAEQAVPLLRRYMEDSSVPMGVRLAMTASSAVITKDKEAFERVEATATHRFHHWAWRVVSKHSFFTSDPEELREQIREGLEEPGRPGSGVGAAVRLLRLTGETGLPLELARRGLSEPGWRGWTGTLIEALGDSATELSGPLPPVSGRGMDVGDGLGRGLSAVLVTGDRGPLREAMDQCLRRRGMWDFDTWVRRLGREATPFHSRLLSLCEGEAPLMADVYLDERLRERLRAVLRDQGAAGA